MYRRFYRGLEVPDAAAASFAQMIGEGRCSAAEVQSILLHHKTDPTGAIDAARLRVAA
jgi:hypothetical protein